MSNNNDVIKKNMLTSTSAFGNTDVSLLDVSINVGNNSVFNGVVNMNGTIVDTSGAVITETIIVNNMFGDMNGPIYDTSGTKILSNEVENIWFTGDTIGTHHGTVTDISTHYISELHDGSGSYHFGDTYKKQLDALANVVDQSGNFTGYVTAARTVYSLSRHVLSELDDGSGSHHFTNEYKNKIDSLMTVTDDSGNIVGNTNVTVNISNHKLAELQDTEESRHFTDKYKNQLDVLNNIIDESGNVLNCVDTVKSLAGHTLSELDDTYTSRHFTDTYKNQLDVLTHVVDSSGNILGNVNHADHADYANTVKLLNNHTLSELGENIESRHFKNEYMELLENRTCGETIVVNALVSTDDSGNIVGNFIGNVDGISTYVKNINDHSLYELQDGPESRHFVDKYKTQLDLLKNVIDLSGTIINCVKCANTVETLDNHVLSELGEDDKSYHFSGDYKELLDERTFGDIISPNSLVATDDSGNIVGTLIGTSTNTQYIDDHYLSELLDSSGSYHFTEKYKSKLDLLMTMAMTDCSCNNVHNGIFELDISTYALAELQDTSESHHFTDKYKKQLDVLDNIMDVSGNILGYIKSLNDHKLSELTESLESYHFRAEHKDLLEQHTCGDTIVPNALVATDDSGNIVGNFVGNISGKANNVHNISDHLLSELCDASGSHHFTNEFMELLVNTGRKMAGDIVIRDMSGNVPCNCSTSNNATNANCLSDLSDGSGSWHLTNEYKKLLEYGTSVLPVGNTLVLRDESGNIMSNIIDNTNKIIVNTEEKKIYTDLCNKITDELITYTDTSGISYTTITGIGKFDKIGSVTSGGIIYCDDRVHTSNSINAGDYIRSNKSFRLGSTNNLFEVITITQEDLLIINEDPQCYTIPESCWSSAILVIKNNSAQTLNIKDANGMKIYQAGYSDSTLLSLVPLASTTIMRQNVEYKAGWFEVCAPNICV
jgi:hypothetical protein